jgi:peptidyl-prolyl cis-trans isomerase D
MLRGIHKASSGWVGKGIMAVVMGLIAISFAIWGIGDIFRGFGQSHFAEIGDTTISADQFRNYYNDKLNQFGRRMGRPITPDQARALGLDRQILGQLIAETALDQKAKQMHLGVSDEQVSQTIMSESAFQGVNGKFDRARFEQVIRDAGFTEPRFVQEQRTVTMRRQIALSLTGDLKPPKTAKKAINIFRNEKRTADIIVLGEPQAGEIAEPTPEVLQKYFEERKALFRAPETRKVALLLLTPSELARWETVDDQEAKTYYEQHKAEFGTPERRHVRQILFPNAEEAKAAAEKIAQGTSFEDIVKQRGLKDTDTDLGTVTKADIIDPAVADAAFSLKDGETSAPVQGKFGAVIVQVSGVQPATQQSYEQAAARIKENIAVDRARRKLGDLRDKIEDERAGGSTLAETAKKIGVQATTIESIDRSGRDAAGNPVPLPKGADVVNALFATDVGVDNEPLQMPGGGWLWYDVIAITPSRERTLDEVKAQVETRWREDQIAQRLAAKADDMVAKLKDGKKLGEIADAENLKVEAVTDLQRGHPKAPISSAALDAVFRTAKGAPGTAEGDSRTTRLVFAVTDVIDAPLASFEAEQSAEALKRGYSEDILGEYVARLETELGVNVNQAALAQITGGGAAAR